MKQVSFIVLVGLVLAGAAWGHVHFLGGEVPFLSAYLDGGQDKAPSDGSGATGEEGQDEKPKDVIATAKAVPVRKGVISETRTLYGSIVPGIGSLVTISAPFECKVLRILVRKGHELSKDDPLIEIAPSEDSRLSLEQARNKSAMAKQELDRVKQRIALKLATNQELIQAEAASRDADLQLESLSRKGMAKPVTICAESPGIVNAISVQEGAIAGIGGALLDLASLSKLEAQLGAEPDIMPEVAEGQLLSVTRLGRTASGQIPCPIRGVAQAVNPATHLVDVFVTLPEASGLMLGAPVQGELTIRSKETLIIPRSAALPEEGHCAVFVLKDGHARKVAVDLGMENAQDVEVRSEELHENDSVAILGNYELEDGMAVQVGAAS